MAEAGEAGETARLRQALGEIKRVINLAEDEEAVELCYGIAEGALAGDGPFDAEQLIDHWRGLVRQSEEMNGNG